MSLSIELFCKYSFVSKKTISKEDLFNRFNFLIAEDIIGEKFFERIKTSK